MMMSSLLSTSLQADWQAEAQVVEKFQKDRPGFCFEEDQVPEFSLPPLWEPAMGAPTPEGWVERRKVLKDLFVERVFGKSPGRPDAVHFTVREEKEGVLNGAGRFQRVEIRCVQGDQEVAFECGIVLPANANKPVPVFLLLNNRRPTLTDPFQKKASEFWPASELLARGYGAAAIQVRQLAPDSPEDFRNGVIRLFESHPDRSSDAWGALAAWAWGAQRVMDFFETHLDIDASRVAVVGHSRGGKAALWAGATDERFALTISNGSGCGGAALSRRRFGETVARLNQRYPHWFCRNFHTFNDREDDLPVDQHQLLALMAPRAVYVASADEDLWADPKGEFLALAHASPAFEIFGHCGLSPADMPVRNQSVHADRQAYHIRSGPHDLTLADWQFFLDYADRLWGRSKSN
jgi:pimeloyl-ACP methyl ester carboxylesterase